MDNKKIGKLIADLRKRKGLTQQDLGDMVGVGFRAVSKWERGITMPDISIINELSKILGITSDELLSGEVKKENKSTNKKKLSNKIKITISIITVIILIITSTIIYLKNKTYVYEIAPIDVENYHIEGQIMFKKDELTIIVNKLRVVDKSFQEIIIKNYEYELLSDNNYIFGYGIDPNGNNLEDDLTIAKFAKSFRINYTTKTELKRKEIIKKDKKLIFNFIDKENNTITKEIELIMYKK